MTTYAFPAASQQVFQFQPVLDGATYNVVVTWNVFGQRWYANVFDLSGNRVLTIPVLSSPSALNLQSLSWANGRATATATTPHGFLVGATVRLTISGCSPDGYDGVVDVLSTGPSSFSWALASDPGDATVLGSAGYVVNMLDGYFGSTMTFDDPSSSFTVSP